MEDVWLHGRSLLGIFAFIAFAWVLGPRKSVPFRLILFAVALQFLIAWALYTVPVTRAFLASLTGVVEALQAATTEGASFVFGYLGGGPIPFVVDPERQNFLFVFAFQALPMLIVLSALSALLWRWRVLEFIVRGFAYLFRRALNLSGAASLGAAANIFLGMTESPVLIRPRLPQMSRADLFLIMTVGFSTVAGSVMAVYAAQLGGVIDGVAGHILTASLISVPAAVLFARLMLPPESEIPAPDRPDDEKIPTTIYHSSMDALTTGVADGVRLFINVVAMLLVFTSLVALVNIMLGAAPDLNGAPLSVERVLGWVFAPFVWLAGVPWAESQTAGSLMGLKTALNEIYAYDALARAGEDLAPRTRLIMAYALCGFANFSSVGILIGGLVAIAPSRRTDILELAPRALISGTLATLSTGAVIGALPGGVFGL
ncbi:MAG: nucleoside:proton symporter [Maricaulaceae bacterium]|nr:nucleoside:proton symporter [Maricaulaceae bacterium]